jgi:hypothetical protein
MYDDERVNCRVSIAAYQRTIGEIIWSKRGRINHLIFLNID